MAVVVVLLEDGEHSFVCNPDQTILAAATDAGITVPSSCREGHCGACMAKLLEGTVEQGKVSGLSRRDRLAGYILACQGRPTSDNLRISYGG